MGKYLPVIKTAECGSLTRAARVLGYSQPSLSYIINTVERELGVKIFDRSQRGMTVTVEGQEVLDIMLKIEALEDSILDLTKGQEQAYLRVGVLPDIASCWMPGILREFHVRYPSAQVKLEYLQDPKEGERRIKEGALDAFFSLCQPMQNLEDYLLYHDPYYLVVSQSDPLAYCPIITAEDALAGIDLLPTEESREISSPVYDLYQKYGRKGFVDFQPQGNDLTISLVESGLGRAILPSLALSETLVSRGLRAIPLEDTLVRQLRLVCIRETVHPPLLRGFLDSTLAYMEYWRQEIGD